MQAYASNSLNRILWNFYSINKKIIYHKKTSTNLLAYLKTSKLMPRNCQKIINVFITRCSNNSFEGFIYSIVRVKSMTIEEVLRLCFGFALNNIFGPEMRTSSSALIFQVTLSSFYRSVRPFKFCFDLRLRLVKFSSLQVSSKSQNSMLQNETNDPIQQSQLIFVSQNAAVIDYSS